MSILRSLSIRNKLAAISLLVSAMALGAGFTFVMVNDIRTFREDVRSSTVATARLFAENAVPTLAFGDERGAAEVLAKLQSVPSIVAASVHDGNGRLFAAYGEWGEAGAPARLDRELTTGFEDPFLHVVEPIVYRGRGYGTIYLRASTAALDARIRRYQLIMFLVAALLIVSSFYLARVLMEPISGRLLTLADVAAKITRTRDYTVRVVPKGNDEIDSLYRAFNAMLEEIHARETERDEASAALRSLNAELERRVAERTAELEARNVELARARDAAESADRFKSAFLATMSHELRTPLNSVIGFSGILLRGLAGPLNAEQSKQLGMVCNSAEHLLALINDVLDLSKIEAGQLQLVIEPFDLRASIEKAAAGVRPQAAKKGLTLEVDIAPGVGAITSDRRRVEQVLLNLLSNGIKFTERGGVRLEAAPGEERVVVRVSDTGLGIRDEDLDKLFKPFSQVDSGVNKRHEGTGLGLSICKRLVELLGGTIWVRSEWGAGSTFGFELPIAGAQA